MAGSVATTPAALAVAVAVAGASGVWVVVVAVAVATWARSGAGDFPDFTITARVAVTSKMPRRPAAITPAARVEPEPGVGV